MFYLTLTILIFIFNQKSNLCKVLIWFLIFLYRGNPANKKRYQRMMIVGYSFPTSIVLCTLIAEHSAPECAKLKPRFGEEGCFFAGNLIFFHTKRYNRVTYFLKSPIYDSFHYNFSQNLLQNSFGFICQYWFCSQSTRSYFAYYVGRSLNLTLKRGNLASNQRIKVMRLKGIK